MVSQSVILSTEMEDDLMRYAPFFYGPINYSEGGIGIRSVQFYSTTMNILTTGATPASLERAIQFVNQYI